MPADTFSHFQPTYHCRGGRPYVGIFPTRSSPFERVGVRMAERSKALPTHVGVGSNPTPDTSPHLRCFFVTPNLGKLNSVLLI